MGIVKEFWSQYFILRNWSEYFDFKTFKPPSDFNGAVQRVKENFKHYFAHHIIIGLVFIVLIGLMFKASDFLVLNALVVGGAVALFHVWETLEIKGHNVTDYEKLAGLAVVYLIGLWFLDRFRFCANTFLFTSLIILAYCTMKTISNVVESKKKE